MDDDRPLRNPFRSEADAFRLLLIIGGAVAAVVIAGALGGRWVGGPLAAILLAAGVRATYRWLKQGFENPDADEPKDEPASESAVTEP